MLIPSQDLPVFTNLEKKKKASSPVSPHNAQAPSVRYVPGEVPGAPALRELTTF